MNDGYRKRSQARGRSHKVGEPSSSKHHPESDRPKRLEYELAVAEDGVIAIYPPHARNEA